MMAIKYGLYSFIIFCTVVLPFLRLTTGNPVPGDGVGKGETSYDESVIALLKENAEKLPPESFEFDIVLLQEYNETSGLTAYISPTLQKPIYTRKSDDREQNIIVLSRSEDFTNYKKSIRKKNYYVLLRKMPGESNPQKYNPFVAYIRGTSPKDTENIITIAGKKRSFEWDQWEEKMSPHGNPQSSQALFCISSFLVPCGSNLEVLSGPNITKSMRYIPKTPSDKDMQKVRKAKYETDDKKQAGRGLLDGILGGGDGDGGGLLGGLLGGILGGGEGGGGLLGGILGGEGGGLLGGILGGGEGGGGLLGGLLGGILGGGEDGGGLLGGLLGGILGGGEGGGGLLGGILGGEGGGLLGGILGGGEDGGGGIVGGVLNAAGGIVCSVFGIFGGGGCGNKKKKQTNVVNVVQHVAVPVHGPPMGPPQPMMVYGRKKKEVEPDSPTISLLDFPGWKTQFVTANPGVYHIDSSEIFHGFGNCPSPSVGKEDLEKANSNEEIVDFYLTVMRTECVAWMKPVVLKMISEGILEVTNKALSMANNPLTKKPKLSMKEALQVSSGGELCAFTNSYLEEINSPTVEEPKSPDEKPISRSINFFLRSLMTSLMKIREFARLHIIRLTKNMVATTNMILLKLSEDAQNLKICGKECNQEAEMNYNDRVVIIAVQQFIKHGLGPVEAGNNALEAFKKFYLYKNNLELIQFETNIRT